MRIGPIRIAWGERGGLRECPYFRRWVVDFGRFSLRLHRWYADDDHRALHDHPTWFWTLVLRGGYTDVSETGREDLRAGSIRFRPAEYRHSVQDVLPNTWTLLLFGPPLRRWGFWINGKLIKRDKYFAVHGHHPCDAAGEPVRQKPDGTRI